MNCGKKAILVAISFNYANNSDISCLVCLEASFWWAFFSPNSFCVRLAFCVVRGRAFYSPFVAALANLASQKKMTHSNSEFRGQHPKS